MTFSDLKNALKAAEIPYTSDCPLSSFTTFRIGGNARLAVFPQTVRELQRVLTLIREAEVHYAVLGAGSNTLPPDRGFDGVVVLTSKLQGITLLPDRFSVSVLAGTPLSRFAVFARDMGLSGAEFLYGIPGSCGGAVVMNAGAYGGEVKDILVSSSYLDAEHPGANETELPIALHEYGYRESIYRVHPSFLVTSATFSLTPGDPSEISETMNRYLSQRKEKQPLSFPSAGSVFKRPAGTYAGKLIESCGLKGFRIGGAEVSEKHAGFIVNCGSATEADVRALAAHIRETVFSETGYLLESEICTMGGEPL